LRAVTQHYIKHSVPLGSQTLAASNSDLGSSATVRKEMHWLEEQGFLAQPHTSAGRVPTELGYRYFVDSLMGPCELKQEELHEINYFFGHISGEAEKSLMETSQLLSGVTHCASIVLSPNIESATLLSLQLVKMSSQVVLMVAVLSNGVVEKRTLEFAEELTQDQLARASHALSDALIDGQPIESHFHPTARGEGHKEAGQADVSGSGSGQAGASRSGVSGSGSGQSGASRSGASGSGSGQTGVSGSGTPLANFSCDPDVRHIADATWQALSELTADPQEHIFVGGTSELAGVFDTIDTLREILATLEQQYIVVTMLRDLVDRGVKVSIGSENQLPPLHECALVVAPYTASDSDGGSVAVVGPTHMNYPKAMAAVRVISGQLSDLLCE